MLGNSTTNKVVLALGTPRLATMCSSRDSATKQ